MPRGLDGRCALVTGGAACIGRASARRPGERACCPNDFDGRSEPLELAVDDVTAIDTPVNSAAIKGPRLPFPALPVTTWVRSNGAFSGRRVRWRGPIHDRPARRSCDLPKKKRCKGGRRR